MYMSMYIRDLPGCPKESIRKSDIFRNQTDICLLDGSLALFPGDQQPFKSQENVDKIQEHVNNLAIFDSTIPAPFQQLKLAVDSADSAVVFCNDIINRKNSDKPSRSTDNQCYIDDTSQATRLPGVDALVTKQLLHTIQPSKPVCERTADHLDARMRDNYLLGIEIRSCDGVLVFSELTELAAAQV